MGPKIFLEVKIGRKMGFLWQGMDLASNFYDKSEEKRRKKPFKDEDKVENKLRRIQRRESVYLVF